MLLVPHTIVGVAIAATVPNPLISVPLSFGLHFLGDMVPHWDFYTGTTREERLKGWIPLAIMADLTLGVATGVFFTLYALWVVKNPHLALNIFMCGIASVLPDVITGPSMYIEHANGISKIVHKIQSKLQFQTDLPWGLITQLVVVAASLLLISGSIIL